MEKEELLLPVQASMNSSHSMPHFSRYTSPLPRPYNLPPHPQLKRNGKQKWKENKEKNIKKGKK